MIGTTKLEEQQAPLTQSHPKSLAVSRIIRRRNPM
jgi:hypothetical protein